MSLDEWLDQAFAWQETGEHQFDIRRLVRRRPFAVELLRGTTKQAIQNVLIATIDTASEEEGPVAEPGTGNCQLIGYRDYAGKTTFDVKRGDLFFVNATQFRVTYVDDLIPGRRTAHCESVQGNLR